MTEAPTRKHFRDRVSVPEDKLRLRYFKMSIFREPRSDGAMFEDDPLANESYRIPGSIPIVPGSIGIRLGPVKSCIYCGSTEYADNKRRPLSDEHIISGALGGNFVLQEASCGKCADYTSAVESSVLNDLFWAPRHRLKLRKRTRWRERKDFAFTTVVNGQPIELKLPLERHPTMLFMPSMFAPGILTNRGSEQSGICGLWTHWLNDLSLANAAEIMTPALDTVRFCQFIAKIGHSFAVAAVGTDAFAPLLSGLIRRKFARTEQYPECYHLIGGYWERSPAGPHLHELGLAFTRRSTDCFLSTHIRLFANLGAPIYVAVVGKLNSGLTPEQVLARWKFPKTLPERTHDRSPADSRRANPIRDLLLGPIAPW